MSLDGHVPPYGGYDSEEAWAADDPAGYAFNSEQRRRMGSDVRTADRLPPDTRVRCRVAGFQHRTGTVLCATGWVAGEGWFYDIAWDGERAGNSDRYIEPITAPGPAPQRPVPTMEQETNE